MKIVEIEERIPSLAEQLLKVWKRSVKATHLFLSDDEIERIEPDVRHALNEVTHLIVAENEKGEPVAFMGVTGEMLEMLFIAPKDRGKGVGKQLLLHGIKCYGIRKVTVNEQNPQAKGFYEHMGFQVYARTDHDEQGNPYPLLYMRR